MTDIERRLRTAMHDAIDGEEVASEELIVAVKRRHRRHNGRLAGVATVALVVVVLIVGAVTGGLTGSGSSALNQAASGRTKPVGKLSGVPFPAGTNFELLVGTEYGAGWYSTATYKTTPIHGLPATFGGYQFNRMNGGWAAWPEAYDSPCITSVCAGPPTTFYFITEGSQKATRIGPGYAGDGVNPGTRAKTIWLVTYPRITTPLTSYSFAQLVSPAGRPLGPRYRMPANTLMGRGIGRYLLLNLDTGIETDFEVWDTRTNRVLGHYDNVIAQGPEQFAWSRGCHSCHVQITNISTGKTITTPIPGALPATNNATLSGLNATLSDDGQLLAVQLPSGGIAVYNTVTRSLTRVPATALSTTVFENFGWQNGGHRLVIFAGPNSAAGPDQLAYWQPGDAHLYVTTVRNLTEITDLQTGTV